MENDIKKIQDDFIEMIGNLCESLSIARILGQIYAFLYMSQEPVSMDEIVERLNVSKGNVSVNINILEGWGAVRKVWVKGSRKNFYTADPDIMKIVSNRLREGINRRIDSVSDIMENIKGDLLKTGLKLPGEKKQDLSFYNERLDKIYKLKEKLANMIEAVSALINTE